jgi:hypothetical protein
MAQLENLLFFDNNYSINGADNVKPGSFKSTNVETNFLKKILPLKEEVSKIILPSLVAIQLGLLLTSWADTSKSKLLSLLVHAVLCCLFGKNYLPISKPKGNLRKAAGTAASQARRPAKPQASLIPDQTTITFYGLIIGQELFITQNPTDPFCWFSVFVLACLLHASRLESISNDYTIFQGRLIATILLSFFNLFTDSLWVFSFLLLRSWLMYVLLLNSVYRLNRLVRQDYLTKESLRRWGEQMTDLINSLPYPCFIIDKESIMQMNEDAKPRVKIVFFNYKADSFVKNFDNEEEGVQTNFLDLISHDDSSLLFEKVCELKETNESIQVFTTEIPKEVYKNLPPPASYKCDVVLWSCKWKDKDVISVLFNNDAYVGTKSNKFATRYLKGLNYLLEKIESNLLNISFNICKVHNKQIEYAKFTEQLCTHTIDMWLDKIVAENFVIFENLRDENTKKVFRLKILLLNVIDLVAKDFCKKGVSVSVNFSQSYPMFIRAKLIFMRSFFFNLLRHIERRLTRGSISIYCDWEERTPSNLEDPEDNLILNFVIKITAPEGCPFPEKNLLSFGITGLQKDFVVEEDMTELLNLWMGKLIQTLDVKVVEESGISPSAADPNVKE